MENVSLSGNWVDLVILVFLFFYLFERLGRGFFEGSVDLAGFLLSLLTALRFYPFASKFLMTNFSLPIGIANALGFLFLALTTEFFFFMFTSYLARFIDKRIINNKINYVLGLIPTIISGLVLVGFILTIFLVLPIRPDIKQHVAGSKIGGYLTEKTLGLERQMSEVFGDALQETLTFLTVKPQDEESIDLNFETDQFSEDLQSEQQMLTLINKERQRNSLHVLEEDDQLRNVARMHCEDMFRRGYFSHYTPDGLSPFDRMENAGVNYISAGENLAYAPNVQIAHTGLMNSPGHRANILSSDFGRVGIGVIEAGMYGRMFCQEFRN